MTSARRSRPATPLPTPCQAGRKRASARGLHGLDLAAQAGQRAASQQAQHLRVAPFPLDAAGPELAAQERRRPRMSASSAVSTMPRGSCQRAGRLVGEERAVAARPAREQAAQRVMGRRQRGSPPARRPAARHRPRRGSGPASSMAIQRSLARRCGRATARRSACERLEPLPGGALAGTLVGAPHARGDLVRRQVAEAAQQVVDGIGRARRALRRQRLELELEVGEGVAIEELAQLLRPEQLAQQVAVERQRLGAPLEERRVALVHVRGDVVEQQGGRERRGARRLDADDPDLAPLDGRQRSTQRGQVEDVLEDLPIRLEDDRERAVAARDGEELRGALAHLPERRALARPASRQQQRPGRVLAEAAGEERRATDGLGDELLDLVGRDEEGRLGDRGQGRRARGTRMMVRRPDVGSETRRPARTAVAAGSRMTMPSSDQIGWTSMPSGLPQARLDGQRPGRVDAGPERRQQADAPVAELVAEALARRSCGRWAGRPSPAAPRRGSRARWRPPARRGRGARASVRSASAPAALPVDGELADLAREGAQLATQLDRSPDGVALPERHLAGLAGRRRHEHPVVLDRLDAPGAGAEEDDLAFARLVDHLLVELADPPSARSALPGRGSAGGRRPVPSSARKTGKRPRSGIVPPEITATVRASRRAWTVPATRSQTTRGSQLGELVGRVLAGEHPERRLEDVAPELGEVLGSAHGARRARRPARRGRRVVATSCWASTSSGLRGTTVVSMAPSCMRRVTTAVSSRSPRYLGKRTPRDGSPTWWPARPTRWRPRATESGRLDLDDEVDRAHVDAELERGGRDDRGQAALLELLLDEQALLARDRAVVGARERPRRRAR